MALSRDLSNNLGRVPPQATELEVAVLGAMMLERNAVALVIDALMPEDFYIESHRNIFRAIKDLYRADRPVDMRTVWDMLKKNGLGETSGGAAYLAELTAAVASSSNIEDHAKIVAEHSMRRKAIAIGSSLVASAYDDTRDIFEVIEEFDRRSGQEVGRFLSGNALDGKKLMAMAMQNIMGRKSTDGVTGVPTGFKSLDRSTAGWQKGELIIIAARPGMGKTAFVVSGLTRVALDHKIPVLMFSLEMNAISLADRMLSSETQVPLALIRRNRQTEHDSRMLFDKSGELAKAPFFIDDTSGLSIFEIKARAKRYKTEHGIGLVIVDYLQLIRGEKGGNREQEIGSISRGLKELAKNLDVPVIALSQLSRGVEARGGDKRPQLSDLRESGSIEQDADIVVFLYRPEYYNIMADQDGNSTRGCMEVIVAKHRNGAQDNMPLRFIGAYTKVTDWDEPTGRPLHQPPVQESLPYKDW